MHPISIAAGLVSTILFLSVSQAEPPKDKAQAVTIPLDQIWAYEMPGTRKIEELDTAPREVPGKGLLGTIFESSFHRAADMRFKDVARPGFAVSGHGVAALRTTHAAFVDKAKPSELFSPDEEVTIVFFAEPISRYRVQIRQVTRDDNDIELRYQLIPSISASDFKNLALIPLGKLPVGKYRVAMRQLPREPSGTEIKFGFKSLDEEWSRNFLCQPFSFTVAEKRE